MDRPDIPAAVAEITTDDIKVGDDIRRLIESNSFKINESKVRLRSRSQRQEVTGLVTNAFPNVSAAVCPSCARHATRLEDFRRRGRRRGVSRAL